MKKRITGIILGLCVFFSFVLTGCGYAVINARTVTDEIGASAVSTVRLLGTGVSAGAIEALAEASDETATAGQTEQTEETGGETGQTEQAGKSAAAEKFGEYFRAFDGFTGADVVKTNVSDNTDVSYAYAKKMTIEGAGISGEKTVYTMYYDETVAKTETEEGETEVEYALSGVMIVGEKEYAIEGERTEETSDGEREDELKIRAYADKTDKSNYVEMKKEVGTEIGETEIEYVYSVYRGGKIVEEVSIEIETETENGKEVSEYELKFIKGETKGKYEVERFEKNGKTAIEVKYSVGAERGKFTVYVTADENGNDVFDYVFTDGSEV